MEKKIIEEKENMKVQQAAFDKILPGVQARCAVFFNRVYAEEFFLGWECLLKKILVYRKIRVRQCFFFQKK